MSTAVLPTTAPELTPEQLDLQQRARTFVETVLMPLELEAEELGGRLQMADILLEPHVTPEEAARKGTLSD